MGGGGGGWGGAGVDKISGVVGFHTRASPFYTHFVFIHAPYTLLLLGSKRRKVVFARLEKWSVFTAE